MSLQEILDAVAEIEESIGGEAYGYSLEPKAAISEMAWVNTPEFVREEDGSNQRTIIWRIHVTCYVGRAEDRPHVHREAARIVQQFIDARGHNMRAGQHARLTGLQGGTPSMGIIQHNGVDYMAAILLLSAQQGPEAFEFRA